MNTAGESCVRFQNRLTNCGAVQDVDEKLLYDTFSAFGVIVTNPKVQLPSCLYKEKELPSGFFQSWVS